MNNRRIADKKVFFLDGDGNLYLDDTLLPGAIEMISWLEREKKVYFICTNNSSKSPQQYEQKFQKMGLPVLRERILTSSLPALTYLKKKHQHRCYWLANDEVSRYFIEQGLEFETKNPSSCLVAYDTTLTYDKLVALCHFVRAGVPFYATHPDKVCPSLNGPLPDVGAFLALIYEVTGKCPDQIFGKPNTAFILPILSDLMMSLEDAVMFGDRLYTDIQLGQNNGLTTVLNLSGETTAEMLESSAIQPDITVESLLSFFS